MSKIVLCDIDGTIANNDHRQHYLKGKKDWDGFFSELSKDIPIYPVINLVNDEHQKGNKIVFLTGRPEKYRYSTTLWLKDFFNFEIILLMRKNNDKNNKLRVKKEIFNNNFKVNEILYCIDNDYELLCQWKDLGVKTLDANLII